MSIPGVASCLCLDLSNKINLSHALVRQVVNCGLHLPSHFHPCEVPYAAKQHLIIQHNIHNTPGNASLSDGQQNNMLISEVNEVLCTGRSSEVPGLAWTLAELLTGGKIVSHLLHADGLQHKPSSL